MTGLRHADRQHRRTARRLHPATDRPPRRSVPTLTVGDPPRVADRRRAHRRTDDRELRWHDNGAQQRARRSAQAALAVAAITDRHRRGIVDHPVLISARAWTELGTSGHRRPTSCTWNETLLRRPRARHRWRSSGALATSASTSRPTTPSTGTSVRRSPSTRVRRTLGSRTSLASSRTSRPASTSSTPSTSPAPEPPASWAKAVDAHQDARRGHLPPRRSTTCTRGHTRHDGVLDRVLHPRRVPRNAHRFSGSFQQVYADELVDVSQPTPRRPHPGVVHPSGRAYGPSPCPPSRKPNRRRSSRPTGFPSRTSGSSPTWPRPSRPPTPSDIRSSSSSTATRSRTRPSAASSAST